MGRRPDPARRAALLEAAADEIAERGLGVSLRPLAAALGTSPRVLLYHFGSREELFREALDVLRRRAGVPDPGTAVAAAGSPANLARGLWALAATPSAERYLRLFFEMYAAALRNPAANEDLLAGVAAPWVGPVSEALRAAGVGPEEAEAIATGAIAEFHGLLMDRLATGRSRRTDAAFEALVARLEAASGDAPVSPWPR